MIAVIDANIAVALMLDLAYSDKARQAIAEVRSIIAPDLIIHETTNTLWKITMAQTQLASQCMTVVENLPLLFDEIAESRSIAKSAYQLALSIKHPAYDCFYIALAQSRQATLITADQRLIKAIANSNALASVNVMPV